MNRLFEILKIASTITGVVGVTIVDNSNMLALQNSGNQVRYSFLTVEDCSGCVEHKQRSSAAVPVRIPGSELSNWSYDFRAG